MSSELLENLNVVDTKLTQSKNRAVPFPFKMKLGRSSVKRSDLREILFYVTAVDYREEFLRPTIYKVLQQSNIFWPSESMLIDLSCCVNVSP